MQDDYQLKWYNYIPVIFFYSITLFFTTGVFCSFAIDPSFNVIIRILLLIIYLSLLIFTIYYHYKSMTISNMYNNNSDEFLLDSNDLNENSKNYCDKCKKNRPNRTHHCKICGVCILKMDHHCPWIANCVGEKNEREFIYFLLGSTLGTLFIFLLTIKYFVSDFINGNSSQYNYNNNFYETIKEIFFSIKFGTCILSFVLGLFLILLTSNYIMNNVKYDITTIEMLIFRNYKDCPYYNDNLKDNFIKRIKPIPFFNNYLYELDDLKDEPKYKNFDEEVVNLLNKEKEI